MESLWTYLKIMVIIALLLIVSIIRSAQSANILFCFGVASYRHKIAIWPLAEELANKGHKITFLTPYAQKVANPKIPEFSPKSIVEFFTRDKESEDFISKRFAGTHTNIWNELQPFGLAVCEHILKDQEIKEWVMTAVFDLVVVDALYSECGHGIAYKLNAKTILFGAFSLPPWMPDIFGNIPESSWIPDIQYHYEEPMSFMERVYTTISHIYWYFWVRQISYHPRFEEMIRKELYLPDMPSIQELERNTSLVLLNTHFSSEYARSLPPVYVPVGGIHIVESNQQDLPQHIKKFIEDSDAESIVYVSFGTNVNVSALAPEVRAVFQEVFASFKSTRFIWKCDLDRPEELSDNVLVVKWAPQQQILVHKKVRAFITHGGLLSISEAAYHGVPMIVFPLFGDQDLNANLVERSGRGLKLEITRVTKEELHAALIQILTTDRFRIKMAEVSKLLKDRPMKPLETAVWWTEYVLCHNDASSLKPLSMHQTWYQRRLLDVWLFLFSSILLSSLTVFCIIFKYFCRKGQNSVDQSEKSKRA